MAKFGPITIFIVLLCCAPTEGNTSKHSTVTVGCIATDEILAGLKLAHAALGKVESVQALVTVSPKWALFISGRCASDLIGSRAGYFRLRSGASVELSKPVQNPAVGLRRAVGRTMVDSAESIDIPSALRNSSNGRLISLTSALSPGATINRYTAVWSRRRGSLIGFVDIDRASGRHVAHPLFKVPLQVRSAYYLASPDTNYGEITILGPVAGGTKVITVGVAM